MQKTAQKRNVLNKLREMTDISGRAAEKFFNPKFKEVMDHIRKKDDQIRTFVVGKQLGEADIEPGGPALKDALKEAKRNLNRREFMACATDLGFFHEQAKKVANEIASINDKVDEVHHEFLFDELTPEQQEQLGAFKTRFAQQQLELVKEAGVMDFLHNIGTSRGRALAAWEKRYPNEVNKFKVGLSVLLSKSEGLLDTMLDSLKEMAAARDTRHPDDYIKSSAKIVKAFGLYENGKGGFKEFYNSTLKTYIAKMEGYQAKKAVPVETILPATDPATADELLEQEVPETISQDPQTQHTPAAQQTAADVLSKLDHVAEERDRVEKEKAQQEAAKLVDPNKAPDTLRTPPLFPKKLQVPVATEPTEAAEPVKQVVPVDPDKAPETVRSAAHNNFYKSLQSLSGESPVLLASFIRKYASSIKATDPNTSNKLLDIAKRIV